jgi:hypothetical protein
MIVLEEVIVIVIAVDIDIDIAIDLVIIVNIDIVIAIVTDQEVKLFSSIALQELNNYHVILKTCLFLCFRLTLLIIS